MKKKYLYNKTIRFWLLTGLVMLIGQVILGGITRLTGSGLSITSWDIITGVIPPMNKQEWLELFELYKQTPQYHKINADFTLKDFKFIYFWEYFHRLWVRSSGNYFSNSFYHFCHSKTDRYFPDQKTCTCRAPRCFDGFCRMDYGHERIGRPTMGKCL